MYTHLQIHGYELMYVYKQNILNVYHPVRKLDYFLIEREWEREA